MTQLNLDLRALETQELEIETTLKYKELFYERRFVKIVECLSTG